MINLQERQHILEKAEESTVQIRERKKQRPNQGKSPRGSYFFLLGPVFYLCDFYRLTHASTLKANGLHSSKNVRDLK